MSAVSPESLVQAWFGPNSAAADSAIFSEPLYVPYDHLTSIDGWVIWLGHPPVPDWANLFPGPEHLLWGDPGEAIGMAMLVAADYAVRRGAADIEHAARFLRRESPIAVIVPEPLHSSAQPILARLAGTGIPVVHGDPGSAEALRKLAIPFNLRAAAHVIDLGRPHDPGCSFEEFAAIDSIGGNSLSSFLVHDQGTDDSILITGELNATVAIEVGLPQGSVSPDDLPGIESFVAEIPSFLSGVTSALVEESLEIGWRGRPPTPEAIGRAIQLYVKTLLDLPFAEVRIAFSPAHGASPEVGEMRARAAMFRKHIEVGRSGRTDSSVTLSD